MSPPGLVLVPRYSTTPSEQAKSKSNKTTTEASETKQSDKTRNKAEVKWLDKEWERRETTQKADAAAREKDEDEGLMKT